MKKMFSLLPLFLILIMVGCNGGDATCPDAGAGVDVDFSPYAVDAIIKDECGATTVTALTYSGMRFCPEESIPFKADRSCWFQKWDGISKAIFFYCGGDVGTILHVQRERCPKR